MHKRRRDFHEHIMLCGSLKKIAKKKKNTNFNEGKEI